MTKRAKIVPAALEAIKTGARGKPSPPYDLGRRDGLAEKGIYSTYTRRLPKVVREHTAHIDMDSNIREAHNLWRNSALEELSFS